MGGDSSATLGWRQHGQFVGAGGGIGAPSAHLVPFSWLLFGSVKASATDRAEALASKTIEHVTDPAETCTTVTGGQQTKGALPVTSDRFDGAIYSSRGRGYARYNEDGAELFRDERGHLYAAVFDQAGGLGGKVRGEGSAVAAKSIFSAFRKIATAAPGQSDVPALLSRGVLDAHEKLVARRQGEVTTAVAVVLEPGRARLVNSGDSAAMHFDREGTGKTHTEKHEVTTAGGIGCLTHAVGLEPEGPSPDTYEWALAAGDWIVLCSDGLLDSGMPLDEIGAMMREADNAEAFVNTLATKVLKRMALMQAKPDNLTIVAVNVLE